ncbi:hypothetical protein BC567DRAFT_53210 [Phyllosticta citribraziliensis]
MEPQSSDKQTSRSAQATFKDLQPAFKGLENAITQLGDDLAHAGVAKYRQIGDLHRRVRDIVDILSSCSENLLRQYEAREREMEQLLAATRDMVSLERLQRMSEDISGVAARVERLYGGQNKKQKAEEKSGRDGPGCEQVKTEVK